MATRQRRNRQLAKVAIQLPSVTLPVNEDQLPF